MCSLLLQFDANDLWCQVLDRRDASESRISVQLLRYIPLYPVVQQPSTCFLILRASASRRLAAVWSSAAAHSGLPHTRQNAQSSSDRLGSSSSAHGSTPPNVAEVRFLSSFLSRWTLSGTKTILFTWVSLRVHCRPGYKHGMEPVKQSNNQTGRRRKLRVGMTLITSSGTVANGTRQNRHERRSPGTVESSNIKWCPSAS